MSRSAAIAKINPVHQRLVDWLLAQGSLKKGWNKKAAEEFGFSAAWISQIYHSDAFQDYYQARAAEYGQHIAIGLADKVNGLAGQAMDVLAERLETQPDMPTSQVLEIADKALKHAGFGGPKSPQQVNNFIISQEDLAAAQQRMRAPNVLKVIEGSVDEPSKTGNGS